MDDVGFYFFPSFNALFEKIEDDAQRLMLFDAIRRYAFMGEIPKNLPFALDLAFTVIRPNLDASMQNQRNGRKGGRPPKVSATETPVKTPDKNPGKNPPIKQENRIEKARIEGESVFIPPAREEVLAFFKEHNCSTGERYFRKYSATGWKTANNVQIQDWKDHALNWIDEEPTRKAKNGSADTQTRQETKPDFKRGKMKLG